ncbi:MAG: hypothetical protein AAF698_00255 [Pseudomonadota bacterium]
MTLSTADTPETRPGTLLMGLVLAAMALGLAIRAWPVIAGQPILSELFLTEDGYLMLTVARNMAIGLGMSVSDGTIATNGIQPLATFLYTLPYLATDGDRVAGLAGVHLIMIAIGIGAALVIRALAARLLAPQGVWPTLLPWIVAGLWFLGPVLARHSMNGLETGLITLVMAAALLQVHRVIAAGPEATLAARLALGALCGVCFLARIDAALFCIILFAVWSADMLFRQRQGIARTVVWLLPPGLLCLAIAAPWLLNNLLNFGALMPISGPAQSLDAEIGQNAILLPAKLFEYVFPMLPVPGSLEDNPAVAAALGLVVAGIVLSFFIAVLRRGTPAIRATVIVGLGQAAVLATYYGVFFGAPHFLSRYLAPIAPLLIIAALWVAIDLGRRLMPARPALLGLAYGFGGLALGAALMGRLLLPGAPEQGHAQVVAWVAENVPEDTWVGAVQTGTLGYWHARTINLDGKVNPAALDARRTDGHVLLYVVDSDIDYIVDWAGVGNWVHLPVPDFAAAFELTLQDAEANLSVMRRRDAETP